MSAAKLILNPNMLKTLRPAKRVDRPKGASVPAACEVEGCSEQASEHLTIGQHMLGLWCCPIHANTYRPQQTTYEQRYNAAQLPCDPTSKETQAYWRGFADGARELGNVRWLESEIDDYYKRTRGF